MDTMRGESLQAKPELRRYAAVVLRAAEGVTGEFVTCQHEDQWWIELHLSGVGTGRVITVDVTLPGLLELVPADLGCAGRISESGLLTEVEAEQRVESVRAWLRAETDQWPPPDGSPWR
ncbi:hypothetical protein [Nesterenkonia sp. K-15-9-6]|uniref:hypothetical protein n=1 Tax=Nesterenkonia sp. K-15-9-6 TaxID=3093918 RepID=UPI004043F03A